MDATAAVGSVKLCPFTYQAAFCRVIHLRCGVSINQFVVQNLDISPEEFTLLEPNKNGTISLENIKAISMKKAINAMESCILDFSGSLNALQYRRMNFDELCAATLSVHQLEALDRLEQHARCSYEHFEKDENSSIIIEELVLEYA
ncbi:CDPK-related protein kinase [Arachis hypogaea]|nr:CDPK-related protein kinase [Arachis hypogaea]